MSNMAEVIEDVNRRIGMRVSELRSEQGLSLDALAGKSGVSRSMISVIERGESSPTAVVLEKLAAGLRVTLGSLFDAPPSPTSAAQRPVARREDQPEWQDPASGYVRRNISPSSMPQPMQLIEVHFPAGARVGFESGARDVRVHQQIWILEGTMEITVDQERYRLREGDCLAMELNGHTMFHNPARKPARYAVVIASETASRRS
jgi:transcriptional regulator with XRE-family HTH domain